MDRVYDTYKKRTLLVRIIFFGLSILFGALTIIFGTLLSQATAGGTTYLNIKQYTILTCVFGVEFGICFIIACFSLKIRCGRYLIDSKILTVFSGLINNIVFLDEELVESKKGAICHMSIVNKCDVTIDITCNIFTKIKVKYKGELLKTTNRY